jgi:hypothetical protein
LNANNFIKVGTNTVCNHYINATKHRTQMCIKLMKPVNAKAISCFCAIALGILLTSTAAQADSKKSSTDTYVDSVYSWGSWELGIEPAAGGPVALPNNAINNRPANIHFRPSDNSAYGLKKQSVATISLNPTPAPTHLPPSTGPGTAPGGSPSDSFK